MILHNVFFWLKTPNAEVVSEFMAALQKLEKIQEIKQIHVGVPAPIIRPVVDNSYSVGLTVFFVDLKGHDAYQVHPLHKEFLANNKEKWSKVQIYDINV
jgi:pyruvate-formate lyase-activating enzyme